jgi:DNA ligase-1
MGKCGSGFVAHRAGATSRNHFARTLSSMLLQEVARVSNVVKATSKRRVKVAHLAECLRAAGSEAPLCVAFLCGEPRQGKLGIGYRTLVQSRPPHASKSSTLTLSAVDATLQRLRTTTGKGSKAEKGRLLYELFASASESEQQFLLALLSGELRQGAQEGILLEAVASASELPASELRRALMFAGDLQTVASEALTGGSQALKKFGLMLFQPVRPMLAQPASNLDAGLEQLGDASAEYKLDGARVQIHKGGDEVRVYSRNLNDVSASVPEIVEMARQVPVEQFVIDGETIALTPERRPLPFQTTMRRFGRKLDVSEQRQSLPLSVFVFDVLRYGESDLFDQSYEKRLQHIDAIAPSGLNSPWQPVPRLLNPSQRSAAEFAESAIEQGHEGLMLKQLSSSYQAGRRGAAWLKVKPVHSLDLVVLAVEWGSGRREGWLSNLHLGARDHKTNSFIMLGKTFKGLTDEMLRYQTQELQKRAITQDAHTVYVRPELVVEILFDGLQESPHYPGGVALRFARVKRYRPDKAPNQADTIQTVRQIYQRQSGVT